MTSSAALVDEAWRLLRAAEPEAALVLLRPRLATAPLDVAALQLSSLALERLGRVDEAIALMSSVAENLQDASGHIEIARLEAGRRNRRARDAALARALERFPDRSDVHRCLADAADDDGDVERAMSHLERTLELDPGDVNSRTAMAAHQIEIGRVEEALAQLDSGRRLLPFEPALWKANLFPLHYVDGERSECFDAHRRWATRFAQVPRLTRREPLEAPANRRLRVGYLSPDLRDHAVMRFLGRVLVEHDRERFEIHAYSSARHAPDDVTARIRALPLRFHDVKDLELPELAARIAEDRIDVLVDLAGHTDGGRVEVCGYRPAPVQLTWLGYPDTTGLDCLDGRITDIIADPPGAEAFHTERLLRLPCCAWNYASIDVPIEPYAPKAAPTFGSFNGLPKLSPRTVSLWAKLLTREPEARLLLSSRRLPKRLQDAWVERNFGARGVNPSRVAFRAYRPGRTSHLASHSELDVALDPVPYNGTTSTCDALWMGVPVVVLEGDRHVSRVGTSLLRHLGLEELVARDEDEYVEIALGLARSQTRLAELRRRLRPSMGATTLGDAKRFTRELEELYRSEVHRAYEAQATGASPLPGERLHRVEWGTVSTSDTLGDPSTWSLLEHRGRDERDARMLAELVREAMVLEVGLGPGVLSLSMAETAGTLRCLCPDPQASARLARTFRVSGLRAPKVELHTRLPSGSDLLEPAVLRLDPVAPPRVLLPDLARFEPGVAGRPILAARANAPHFLAELEAILLSRDYVRCTHHPEFACLEPISVPPSATNAHVFYVPKELQDGLVSRGLLDSGVPTDGPLGPSSSVEIESAWGRLGYVARYGLATTTLPRSVRLELAARDARRRRSERLSARAAALRAAFEELSADEHPLTRMTAARLLLELRRSDEAADVLGPLTELEDWSSIALDRGFLALDRDHEAGSDVPVSGWLQGQVLSSFVHAAAPSGYFQPNGALGLLGRVEALGLSTPRDDRRFGLCLARAHTLAPGGRSR